MTFVMEVGVLRAASAALVATLALAIAALLPQSAHAALGISSAGAAPANPAAGAYSDFNISLAFSDPSDDVKNLQIDLPAGVIGNPQATPRCTQAQLGADVCPPASQVGSITVTAGALGLTIPAEGTVYNVDPNPGDPAKLGIVVRPLIGLLGKITLESPIAVRDGAGDYGLTSTIVNMPRTLSGIPIDVKAIDLTLSGQVAGGGSFMSNPTRCTPAQTIFSAESYGGAKPRATASFTATDCGGVPSDPAMELTAHDTRTDINAPFTIGVTLPYLRTGRVQSHMRDVDVVLPRGVGLNPPVADGLELCTPEQFMPNNDQPTKCDPSSDIGDVVFETPVLAPLKGDVYFGTSPKERYQLLIVAQDGNLRVKIVAAVRPDPQTGQLTTYFRELPQFPVNRFALTFRGGDKSVLATPPSCGQYQGSVGIVPWSGGGARKAGAAFGISQDGVGGCDQPNEPQISISPSTTKAGADVSTKIDIVRQPRHKPIKTLSTTLPSGLLARINSVPMCSAADANRARCDDTSKIGTVGVDIGAGPRTVRLNGDLFLATPAGDGVLARLAFAIRAKVGPIDLGMYTLLAPISLGIRDGRVQVEAQLAEAFEGIRLNIRKVSLNINRPGFMINPTGCDPRQASERLGAMDGTSGEGVTQVTATNCDQLPFQPELQLRSDDLTATGRGDKPPITVDVRSRGSDSALRDVVVVFPGDLQPNIDLLQNVCNSPAVQEGRCPDVAQVGVARAASPLLPYPLEGKLYLTFPEQPEDTPGLTLPWASVVLKGVGGPAKIRVDGRLALRNGRLEARFTGLPDVPLTRFTVDMKAGALIAATKPCAPEFGTAPIRMFAQSRAERSADKKVEFAACRDTPIATASLERTATTRPVVRVAVQRGPLGGKLRTVALKLPSQLAVRSTRKGITVRVGKRVLSKKRWSLSKRTKTLRINGLGSSGAQKVSVTLAKGAVRAGAKTRKQAARGNLRVRFALTARDTKKKVSSQRFFGYDEAWQTRAKR